MKLLLVKPHSNFHLIVPPIGLAYLASSVRDKDSESQIKILDCQKEGYTFEDFKRFVIIEKPDIIGISVFSCDIEKSINYAKIAKRINKNIKIILGGPHPSIFPNEVLKFKEVDFIFVGEAENSLYLLLETFALTNSKQS